MYPALSTMKPLPTAYIGRDCICRRKKSIMSSEAPGAGVAFATGSEAALFVSMLTTAGSTRFASPANDALPGCADADTEVKARTTSNRFRDVTRVRLENIENL